MIKYDFNEMLALVNDRDDDEDEAAGGGELVQHQGGRVCEQGGSRAQGQARAGV